MKVFKIIISMILSVLMLTTSVYGVLAYKTESVSSGTEIWVDDDIAIDPYNDDLAYITHITLRGSGSVTLPEEVNGYKITGIIGSLSYTEGIKEMIFPESYSYFMWESFYSLGDGKQSIETFTFLGNVERVETVINTHSGRLNLKAINVTDKCEDYASEDGVLYNKDKTILYYYPNYRVKKSFTVPDTVKTIGEKAFYLNNYLENIVFNENVEIINSYAFASCNNLADVDFTNCKKLQTISGCAFQYCPFIKEVYLPDCLNILGDKAFQSCTALVKCDLGKGLQALGKNVFNGCSSLKKLHFPASLTTVYGTIGELVSLGEITIDKDNPIYGVENKAFVEKISGDRRKLIYYLDDKNTEKYTVAKNVYSIWSEAFSGCSLKEVVITGGVIEVGEKAFFNCSNLEKVTMEQGLSVIGKSAFAYCKNLTYVRIPFTISGTIDVSAFDNTHRDLTVEGTLYSKVNFLALTKRCNFIDEATGKRYDYLESYKYMNYEVNSTKGEITVKKYYGENKSIVVPEKILGYKVVGIATSAFKYSNISSLELPGTVNSIPANAFYGSSITSIKLNKGLEKIGKNAFDSCEKLTTVKIPSTVNTIEDYAFVDCENLSSLTIEKGVEKIGKYAFSGCKTLDKVVLPESISIIDEYAFYNCTNLSTINIPDKVSEIRNRTFKSCSNLKSVDIGSGVTKIYNYAFSFCKSLRGVNLPASLKDIEVFALNECTSLEYINVDSKNKIYSSDNGVLYSKDKTQLILYPQYRETEIFTVSSSVSKIHGVAFRNSSRIRKVVLPSTITDIPESLFYNSSVEFIKFPTSVKTMGKKVFENCKKLKKAEFPPKLATIPEGTFLNCTSLQLVILPDFLSDIEKSAFEGCTSLNYIDLNMVKNIGEKAFKTTGLKEVRFPETLSTIGKEAFLNCDATKMVFYKDLQSVGQYGIGFGYSNSHYYHKMDINYYGFKDSTLERYLNDNKLLKFNAIDNSYFKSLKPQPLPDVVDDTKEPPKLSATNLKLKSGSVKSIKVIDGNVKSFTTSDKKVATVNNGKITALNKGTANITAVLTDGKKLVCKVTVTNSPKLSKTSVTVKKGRTVKIKLYGKASAKSNKYKNTKYAKFTSKVNATTLKIKGLKKGKTTLKIKVNGVKTLSVKVKVK